MPARLGRRFMLPADRRLRVGLGSASLIVNAIVLTRLGIRHGGDTGRYVHAAAALMDGRGLHAKDLVFLGYPALIAGSAALGLGDAGVIGVQLAAAALATLAVYDLGCQLAGQSLAGLLAASFFVVDLDIAQWHAYVLTDSAYISAVVLATWLVHRARRGAAGAYLAGALAIVVAVLVRPNGLILAVVAITYWIGTAHLAVRTKLVAAVCVLLVAAGSAAALASIKRGQAASEAVAMRGASPGVEQQPDTAWVRGLDYGPTRHEPESAALAAKRVLVELVHVRSFYSSRHNTAILVVLAGTYPLAMLGFILRRALALTYLMAAVIIGHFAIVAVTFADRDGRYLLYVLPLIAVFAAEGGLATWHLLRRAYLGESAPVFSTASSRRSP